MRLPILVSKKTVVDTLWQNSLYRRPEFVSNGLHWSLKASSSSSSSASGDGKIKQTSADANPFLVPAAAAVAPVQAGPPHVDDVVDDDAMGELIDQPASAALPSFWDFI